nr:hypothetical protein [Tanacetum cinerariifolium]
MFDEYFKPLPNVDHPVLEVPTPVPDASTSSLSSTTVDQDAPSTSTSQTTSEQQSSVIPQGVEDKFYDIEVAYMDNDPYFGFDEVLSWLLVGGYREILMVEINVGGMTVDVVDKLTYSSDDVQPKQVDLRCAHALTKLHWHDIHVVPDRHKVDQR